jgi:hypothetical protein
MNFFHDGCPVRAHGSLLVPTLDVAALSATVVGMCPVAMPCLSSLSSTPIVYIRDLVFGLEVGSRCCDSVVSCTST